MIIVEDTRQQKGKHEHKHRYFGKNGVSVLRSKLPFGDYALPPKVAVDTKENMSEIAQNMCGSTKEHVRFREECKKAKDAGCQLVILIENEDGIRTIADVYQWENPRLQFSATACTGQRLAKTMETMSDRYGVSFQFCTPLESAQRIMEILNNGI